MKVRTFLYGMFLVVAASQLSSCIWPYWYDDDGRHRGEYDRREYRDGDRRDRDGDRDDRR